MKKMNWFNILKVQIKGFEIPGTVTGFKNMCKKIVDTAAKEVWGPAGRKSYIRITDNYGMIGRKGKAGGKPKVGHVAGSTSEHSFYLTFRSEKDAENRTRYDFIMSLDGTRLIQFIAKGIQDWGEEKTFNDVGAFALELKQLAEKDVREQFVFKPKDLTLETGKSELEIKEDMERQNPGYRYVISTGRMIKIEDWDPEIGARRRTLTIQDDEATQVNWEVAQPERQTRRRKRRKGTRLGVTRGGARRGTMASKDSRKPPSEEEDE